LHKSFELDDPLPLKFRPWDRQLYRAIQEDPEARAAFRFLGSRLKGISSSFLLLSVGVESDSGARPTTMETLIEDRDWQRWRSKWEGLSGLAHTLRGVEAKMERHVKKNAWGPAPLAIMGYDRFQNEFRPTLLASNDLVVAQVMLQETAKLIEFHCDLYRKFMKEVPRVWPKQKESTLALLSWVKAYTHRNYFERVAAIVNVARQLKKRRAVSADSLRRLWERNPHLRLPM
jgi:hypothetical protein